MIQIRIHGRGGQGVVTAAELIAIAAFKEGYYAQAFPSFGVERTGAPIEAFARIDNQPIRLREHVQKPDVVIIQDASLLADIDAAKGCHPKSIAIINSSKDKNDLNIKLPKENVFVVDATKIALDIIGKNIVNTVILGAFAKISPLVSLNSLKSALEQKFGKDTTILKKNIQAVEIAYKL